MEATQLLQSLLGNSPIQNRHLAADQLIERLHEGLPPATLDELNSSIIENSKVPIEESGLRHKLQLIGILVSFGRLKSMQLLSIITKKTKLGLKHHAADELIRRLSRGSLERQTLDMLDNTLKKDIWIGIKDPDLRDKLQWAAQLVDAGIVMNPGPYEVRTQRPNFPKRNIPDAQAGYRFLRNGK